MPTSPKLGDPILLPRGDRVLPPWASMPNKGDVNRNGRWDFADVVELNKTDPTAARWLFDNLDKSPFHPVDEGRPYYNRSSGIAKAQTKGRCIVKNGVNTHMRRRVDAFLGKD